MCVSAAPNCRKGDPAKIGMGMVKRQPEQNFKGSRTGRFLNIISPGLLVRVLHVTCTSTRSPGTSQEKKPRCIFSSVQVPSLSACSIATIVLCVPRTTRRKTEARWSRTSWSFPPWDTDVVNAHFWAKNRSACGDGYRLVLKQQLSDGKCSWNLAKFQALTQTASGTTLLVAA